MGPPDASRAEAANAGPECLALTVMSGPDEERPRADTGSVMGR
jgi:hypothetical protein